MSNLAVRVLVALVGIPTILFLTSAGGYYFFGFVVVVSTIGLQEYYTLARTRGTFPQVVPGIALGVLVNGVFLYNKAGFGFLSLLSGFGVSVPFPTMAQLFLILLLLFVPAIMGIELMRNRGSALMNTATTVLGVCYVSFCFGTLVALREVFVPGDFPFGRFFTLQGVSVPDEIAATVYGWGGMTIIAIFASIWICDSAAYFIGRAFGRHKLLPRVSPNKTWEGAIAGFVGAVAAFVAARQLALPYLTVMQAIWCGIIVGVFGQIGDLAESLLKRDAGVKDSSSIIPGHGGILDRFDSLLFVSPLLFLYIDFIVLS